MSRNYKGVFVKKNRVYSVENLMELYSVSANTVSNWVGEGLKPSDRQKPYLFQGAAVQFFHKQRKERLRVNLRPGEFKCTGCKAAMFPEVHTIQDFPTKSGRLMYEAICSDCNAVVFKLPTATDRDIVEDCRNPNTSRKHLHEDNSADLGRIWISGKNDLERIHFENDRIIYKWLTYAGRYDEKTLDRHLAAIRYCEILNDGKSFAQFTVEDLSKVRNELKRRARADSDDRLSPSTIKHTVSHVSAFFDWLPKQDGYRRLPRDLPDYCKMPNAVFSAALPKKPKAYPTIVEAENMMKAMPSRSYIERRARAIFALAFLGALRADTLVSLRIKHVDIPNRRVVQDASVVRAKNGKNIVIAWFPIPPSFGDVVCEWVQYLRDQGLGNEDALFPNSKILQQSYILNVDARDPFSPMSTIHAVTAAFASASRHSSTQYTPHAAKHTIAALRDSMQLTYLQRQAWSETMGHENEYITQTHYGKLSSDQRVTLMESIGDSDLHTKVDFTDDEKIALVNEILT